MNGETYLQVMLWINLIIANLIMFNTDVVLIKTFGWMPWGATVVLMIVSFFGKTTSREKTE